MRCCNRHQPTVYYTSDHFTSPTFSPSSKDFPFRSVSGQLFVTVTFARHQLLLAPAAHRCLFQVDIAFRPDIMALPRNDTHPDGESIDRFQAVKDIGVIERRC